MKLQEQHLKLQITLNSLKSLNIKIDKSFLTIPMFEYLSAKKLSKKMKTKWQMYNRIQQYVSAMFTEAV